MVETFLLGAGASVDAGVPSSNEMSRRIYERDTWYRGHRVREVLDVVLAGIQSRKALQGDPFGHIDIEDVYAALVRLRAREEDLLAPFVTSWSRAFDNLHRTKGSAHDVTEALRAVLDGMKIGRSRSSFADEPELSTRSSNFHAFEQEMQKVVGGPALDVAFHSAAEFVRDSLIDFCTVEVARTTYMKNLVRKARLEGLWVATLNYDDSIEKAAASVDIPVSHGLKDGHFSMPAETIPGTISLIKLHGSVGWTLGASGEIGNDTSSWSASPAVILGAGNKLQIKGPYLDMLFAFRARLDMTSHLHVCGYSFRDEHINHLLATWWRSGGRKVSVHDPGVDSLPLVECFPGRIERYAYRAELSKDVHLDSRSAKAWMKSLDLSD